MILNFILTGCYIRVRTLACFPVIRQGTGHSLLCGLECIRIYRKHSFAATRFIGIKTTSTAALNH